MASYLTIDDDLDNVFLSSPLPTDSARRRAVPCDKIALLP